MLTTKAKTCLGDKNSNIAYNMPYRCFKYTGERNHWWETQRKEEYDKVYLTKQDIDAENIEPTTKTMNTNDGELTIYTSTFSDER